MSRFCWGLFVPSASPTCCSCSTPAEGIRYCRPLATGRCRLRATRLSRPLARFCAWAIVPFAPVRVAERQLLRATHSYSAVVPVALRCLGLPYVFGFSSWETFSRICTLRSPFRNSLQNLGRGEARQILFTTQGIALPSRIAFAAALCASSRKY